MENTLARSALAAKNLLVRLWPWLIVLAILLFIGLIRYRLLTMPLERDEGEYAYAGQLILQGIPPYELAYNMKLPGTYYAYALGMAVFGQTISGIHWTLLVVNLSTMVFVFLLGRELFGNISGLIACASYGLMSLSPAVLGMEAHATQFVVFFAVPGTWLLWRAMLSGRTILFFFSGLLYGLGFVMKQHGICFCLFGLVALSWREWNQSPRRSVKVFTKKILLYGLGAALPFLIICALLAHASVFSKFWFWTFSYAQTYAAQIPLAEGMENFLRYIRNNFNFYIGFWILATVGMMAALRQIFDQKKIVFIIGFLFFSFFGIVPGFYFREHYFVLMLPAFALVVGMAVKFLQAVPLMGMKIIPLILLAAVLAWSIWIQWGAFFQFPPELLCKLIYGNNPFIESVRVASYIHDHSTGDSRVAVIGSEPEIYFYAQRHSATGYIYTYPLMENQPYTTKMQRDMGSEIESAKPKFIVFVINTYSWMADRNSDMEIFSWTEKYIAAQYDRVGLVDYRSGHPVIDLWGEDAKNYHGSLEQFLAVYQRKPDAN